MAGPSLSSGMQSAAATTNPSLGLFFAIELDLPAVGLIGAKTLRLLDGSGVLTWSGKTFTGLDADYGAWAGISGQVEEALGSSSPKFKAGFQGLSDNAIDQLCSPLSQGAPALLYFGFFNPATGAIIDTPIGWFSGVIDVGHIIVGENTRSVDVDLVGASEYLFLPDDAGRLNSAFHQIFFASEMGFEFVDGVTHQLPWGMKGPRPDQVSLIPNYDYGPKRPTINLGAL